MKTLIALMTLSIALATEASTFTKLYSCNNNELVVDVNRENPSEIQLVVNGEHAVKTLIQNNPELQRGVVGIYDNKTKLVIRKLTAYRQAGEFVHLREGTGYYPAERVIDPRSIMDLDEVTVSGKKGLGNAAPFVNIRLELYKNGFFGPKLKREAFPEQGIVRLHLLKNNYFFYNCAE